MTRHSRAILFRVVILPHERATSPTGGSSPRGQIPLLRSPATCKSSALEAKERFVSEPFERPPDSGQEDLRTFGHWPAKDRRDPGVLPRQSRKSELASQLLGHFFCLLYKIGPL